jgi:hypothetical protein
MIAQAALHEWLIDVLEDENFLPDPVLNNVFGTNWDPVFEEIVKIKDRGGMLKHALEHSEYARQARQVMDTVLVKLAQEMLEEGYTVTLVFSHSPWLETAADPETTPYSICESDAVLYTVLEEGVITSEFIPAPIPGKAN